MGQNKYFFHIANKGVIRGISNNSESIESFGDDSYEGKMFLILIIGNEYLNVNVHYCITKILSFFKKHLNINFSTFKK